MCTGHGGEPELLQHEVHPSARQEKEKQTVEQGLDGFRERVGQIETELQELTSQAADSEEVLSALTQFGEDVEEGLAILEERQRLIEECTIQLQAVIERLGANSVENDSNPRINNIKPQRRASNYSDSSNNPKPNSESFCANVELMQDNLSDSRFFSKGNHSESFQKYWENINEYKYQEREQPEIMYIKARDIEGV